MAKRKDGCAWWVRGRELLAVGDSRWRTAAATTTTTTLIKDDEVDERGREKRKI